MRTGKRTCILTGVSSGIRSPQESNIRGRKSRYTGMAPEWWGMDGDAQEVVLHVRKYGCRLPGVT